MRRFVGNDLVTFRKETIDRFQNVYRNTIITILCDIFTSNPPIMYIYKLDSLIVNFSHITVLFSEHVRKTGN